MRTRLQSARSGLSRRLPLPFRPLRRLLLAAALLALCASAPAAAAGFLEDYYDAAGAQTSRTPAGVYQSQGVSLATGGSFVMKVPRKEFTPMTLDAPRLKAGCGGIDVFLGAFSLPSREEFVSFLRSIGTAMPGLAFQLALQSLSPDLNETVTSFRDLIMRSTSEFSDSCTAAQMIFDKTGASAFFSGMGYRAKNALRSSGEADDASEADRLTRTDGGAVLESVEERADSGGTVVEASEINLTWSLLKGGKFSGALSDEDLEMMMTLLGTVIYRKSGSGADATVSARAVPGEDLAWESFGDAGSKTTSLPLWTCDEPKKCLSPAKEKVEASNLAWRIHAAAKNYQQALMTRSRALVKDEELALLANISAVPILGLVEAGASLKVAALSDDLLAVFSEAAAWEAVSNAVENLSAEIRLAVASSSAKDANAISAEHAAMLAERIDAVQAQLRGRQRQLYEAMAKAQQYAAMAAQIERAVFGRAAIEAAERLPSGPMRF